VADLDGALRLWNVESGRVERTLSATQDQRWFTGVAFSPDGALLITGSPNGEIVFWDAGTGDATTKLALRQNGVFSIALSSIALSPDGQRLAVAAGDESVRVFELAPGQ
jgi:WD40 repeat protein